MRFPNFALAGDADMPLWLELWYHISDTYLNSDVYYEHLDVGTDEFASIRMILAAFCIGIAIAAFVSAFNKRTLGGLVRALIRADCLSADSAKTLAELGFSKNFVLRRAVCKSVSLRRVVRCREEEEFLAELARKQEEYERKRAEDRSLKPFRAPEFRPNPGTDRYYIPEEMKYMAETKFEAKGTTWVGAIVTAVLMVVLFFAGMVAMPYILELLNDFAGMIG